MNDERVEEVAATEGDDEDKQEEGIYFVLVINTRINHLFFPLSDRWAGQFILELG